MVELALFIATICLFFHLPVQFRCYYRKVGWDDTLVLEMTFLNGLLKRRLTFNLLNPTPRGMEVGGEKSGKWLFFKKKRSTTKILHYRGNSRGLREFLHRYRHYGLGVTFLTYFLPANYHRWLLVADELEKKGEFARLNWTTRLGLGEPAWTATAYGLVWCFKSGSVKWLSQKFKFRRKPEIKVIADFRFIGVDILFDCIFRVKLGYIIIASFLLYWRYRVMKGGVGIE